MTNNLEERYGPCDIRTPTSRADNQYTLIKTKAGAYYVLFEDGEGNEQESKITEEIYLEMLQQARDDDAKLRWDKRHLDDSADVAELPDSLLYESRGLENMVVAIVLLAEDGPARALLTDLQWRRLQKYYVQRLTLDEIAELDGCTKMGVKNTIMKAIKKLKNFL